MGKQEALKALAKRIAAAEKGSIDLDAEVAVSSAWVDYDGSVAIEIEHRQPLRKPSPHYTHTPLQIMMQPPAKESSGIFPQTPPPITTDLTAAVAFCEAQLPGTHWVIDVFPSGNANAECHKACPTTVSARGHSECLARIAATLKALAAREISND